MQICKATHREKRPCKALDIKAFKYYLVLKYYEINFKEVIN